MSAIYLIIYKSENIELILPLNATLECLKKEIYRIIGLHPSQQDLAELNCFANDVLLISVISTDHSICLSHKKDVPEKISKVEQTPKQKPNLNTEETAYLHFVQLFTLEYGRDHINFQCVSLKEAITSCFSDSTSSDKMLLLYFHNKNDRLSQVICPGFVSGEMRTILEKSYKVLPWDLSTNVHEALEMVLDEWVELKFLKQWLFEQKSALFIIYSFEESVFLYNILHGDTLTLNQICQQLKKADDAFQENLIQRRNLRELEQNMHQSNDIGFREFHQMMFDRLGDRDYDSFQPDEHTYLKDKIGFAKFGPPQMESGYDDAQNNSIDETYELIVNNNNRYAKWKNRVVVSFIYNCLEPLPQQKLEKAKQCSDYNPYTDITPVPVFVIRKCRGSEHPCRMFVDCDNRVYSSWDDYITTNKLNQYTMILPKHGRYDGDSNGTVLLETHATPSCSIQYTLAQHADSASSVAGIASGAVLLTAAVSAIPVAPLAISAAIVTGAGAGLYSIARSGFNLYDRATHGETMSITNSEARGAYLNIIAGTLGLVGAGATGATARFATQGVHIGEGARVTVDVLNIANTTLGAAALANASYEMYDTWRESGTISPLSLLQLGSSVLFFGNAVYNFKTANTIINEAQTNALQDHEKSLRSNRHRKTFNKLLKETIRQNNGNVQAGRAEVISTISTMSNRDDVLAVLTRNNRRFNKNGVCFAAEGGRITLNGIAVDLINMDIMSNNHRTQFLIDLPTIPNGNAPNPRLIYPNNFFETLVGTENTSTYTKYAMQIYQNSPFLLKAYKIMFNYSEETQTKIFKIFLLLLEQLELRKVEIVDLFREYDVSNESPYIFCLNSTIEFLKIKINEYERQFQTNNNSYSNLTNLGTVERSKCWLSTVINNLIDDRVDQIPVKELLKFVVTKLSSKIYNFLQRELVATRMAATTTPGIKTSCTICGGYYYVHQSADGGL